MFISGKFSINKSCLSNNSKIKLFLDGSSVYLYRCQSSPDCDYIGVYMIAKNDLDVQ